jgi:predicted nuclease of predicted toxin-antitoxin system
VKFLVDAHLPRRLCAIFVQHGHDATHTLDLPTGNKTKDPVINQLSVLEQRVVVSKDSDFFYSHVLQGRPWKLLLIKTGNISSQDVCALLERHLPTIETVLHTHTLVEIDRSSITPVM